MKKSLVFLLAAIPAFAFAEIQISESPNASLLAQVNNQQQAQAGNTIQSQNQNNAFFQNSVFGNENNTSTTRMFQKDIWDKLRNDTSLSYYHQFLGPTAKGRSDETYNVFQAASSGAEQKSGRAPIQSFHAFNLRHQINQDWAIGVSLAVSKGYGSDVTNKNGDLNKTDNQFFNARVNLNLPSMDVGFATLFSTLSYEAPTSVISREQDMTWGWVVAETLALKLPSTSKWRLGITGQAYRMYYKENVRTEPVIFTSPGPLQGQICTLCDPYVTNMQTLILSAGPYVNYQMSDKWLFSSSVILDWDQVGNQTGTTKFNNNLPHRGRLSATYFPMYQPFKYLTSVGVFTQALLKFRPETTAFGAELSLRF